MSRVDYRNKREIWYGTCWTNLPVILISLASFAYLWHTGFPCIGAIVSAVFLGWILDDWRCALRKVKLSSDRLIVITGCDSGLGFSLALHCRRLGAVVIAGVLQDEGQGALKLRESHVLTHPLDITDVHSVKRFESYVRAVTREKNLALAALVNNAGVLIFGEFDWQTEEQTRYQVEVNLLGTMSVTRALMPIILRDSSRILVVTSHCASEPVPGVAVYSATKAAIHGWATALRMELRKYGVDVVTFVPGSFTKESNILACQDEHFEVMKTAMDPNAEDFYGEYFDRYASYLRPISKKVASLELTNRSIYQTFESALLDRYPSANYKCEPWRYFFYHALFKITPTRVRDRLIEMFVQLPAWDDKERKRRIVDDEETSEDSLSH